MVHVKYPIGGGLLDRPGIAALGIRYQVVKHFLFQTQGILLQKQKQKKFVNHTKFKLFFLNALYIFFPGSFFRVAIYLYKKL